MHYFYCSSTFKTYQSVLAESSQLQTFDGLCLYGRDNHDLIKQLNATDPQECYYECKIAGDCTAFAFDEDPRGDNCALYRGGPYIKGNGRADTKCYIMTLGMCTHWEMYYFCNTYSFCPMKIWCQYVIQSFR